MSIDNLLVILAVYHKSTFRQKSQLPQRSCVKTAEEALERKLNELSNADDIAFLEENAKRAQQQLSAIRGCLCSRLRGKCRKGCPASNKKDVIALAFSKLKTILKSSKPKVNFKTRIVDSNGSYETYQQKTLKKATSTKVHHQRASK
ncbi:hypothetical protein HELRODRAFT_166838 [Helobdella robusta]|uniref:Uncharacterized protein n=1 Tax=Helobdella robusta TaxID=6412 RepID=T1EYL8_HELRO|nr:hypothetical protein HELRODRAFT_166838 [Helobdella robusta]ESO11793.1 hypothetical protein HELRODRAFT_166838 [Helobdella robusta]